MDELTRRLETLKSEIVNAWTKLDIDSKSDNLRKLEENLSTSEIWVNPERAQQISKQAASLRAEVEPWQTLKAQTFGLEDFIALGDESIEKELASQIKAEEDEFARLKKMLLFTGEYDNYPTLIKFQAGAGGVDAQDWTEMVERMYLRWAQRHDFEVQLLDRNTGAEAGLKSATYIISGPKSYGLLKSERGVHRLVRLSPFNADHLRQTSFMMVETVPYIEAPEEIKIDDKDLRIDVYRAGGHGGQSVNTTDSAVRITHVPTGETVAIQNERSQLQNKETALKILKSRLVALAQEQHQDDLRQLKGPNKEAAWGNQIRNYVMHPYTLVKDTRTKYESTDVKSILDGELDEFINSYLEM